MGPCLFLYPEREWDKVQERLERQRARIDPEQRPFYLQLMRDTAETTVDAQGRISIPSHLAELAGIGGEALFVGSGQIIEMWDPGRYAEYVGEAEEGFDRWRVQYL